MVNSTHEEVPVWDELIDTLRGYAGLNYAAEQQTAAAGCEHT